LEVEGAGQIDGPGKTWKELVDKEMNDMHIKPNDAVDHCKWRKMT